VTWTASAENEITLVWREINGPSVRDSTTMGSGMRMIKSALEQELSGTVDFEFQSDGLVCTIVWSGQNAEAPAAGSVPAYWKA
jgi:two-component sensor histidine kinase